MRSTTRLAVVRFADVRSVTVRSAAVWGRLHTEISDCRTNRPNDIPLTSWVHSVARFYLAYTDYM
jgi:hypothetical protein